jgi:hypothetical protein
MSFGEAYFLWFGWIELKFKLLRIKFIFYLMSFSYILNFFWIVAPNFVRFSPGFLSEAGFPGEEFPLECF